MALHTKAYSDFVRELRSARELAGMTQGQLADKLGETQSFVSKFERGERRLDVVELIHICRAMGISPAKFVARVERRLHGQAGQD